MQQLDGPKRKRKSGRYHDRIHLACPRGSVAVANTIHIVHVPYSAITTCLKRCGDCLAYGVRLATFWICGSLLLAFEA